MEKPAGWRGKRLMTILVAFLASLSVLFVCASAAFWGMGFTFCTVQGDSMQPTITDGMRLLLNPKAKIHRFDVVVFKVDGRYLIKRAIGLPGDEVSMQGGELFINGEACQEPYLDQGNCQKFAGTDFSVSVPEDEYFLLGDNRDNSMDSRDIGTVPKLQFVGVPILTLDG